MRKLMFLSVVAIATVFASCSVNGKSLKTNEDSVAYAVGVSIGNMAFELDSTLNVDMIVAGLKNAFKKDTTMTKEKAQTIVQEFVNVGLPKRAKAQAEVMLKEKVAKEGFSKTESGLVYKIADAGKGAKVELNDSLEVHYILSDTKGKKIQSSYDTGKPMTFVNAQGQMIPGFTEGLLLLNEGGKATFVIKSELGYGDQGGPAGPGQPLQFEVEVVKVTKPIAVPEAEAAKTKK